MDFLGSTTHPSTVSPGPIPQDEGEECVSLLYGFLWGLPFHRSDQHHAKPRICITSFNPPSPYRMDAIIASVLQIKKSEAQRG